MFEGLAETLELHRKMLVLDDPNSRKEDEVYRELAASWETSRNWWRRRPRTWPLSTSCRWEPTTRPHGAKRT